MKSQRARWKKRDGSREQRDNDVTETTAVAGGKTRNHHSSSDFPIPLMTILDHRIFVGNISYKVKVHYTTRVCIKHHLQYLTSK